MEIKMPKQELVVKLDTTLKDLCERSPQELVEILYSHIKENERLSKQETSKEFIIQELRNQIRFYERGFDRMMILIEKREVRLDKERKAKILAEKKQK